MNTVEAGDVDAELRLGIGSHHTGSISSAADQRQPINIFSDDRVWTCDVADIQARTIIYLAKKEVEEYHGEKLLTPSATGVAMAPQLLNRRLTMKDSLQWFLQKRRDRISASAPYNQFTHRSSPESNSVASSTPSLFSVDILADKD